MTKMSELNNFSLQQQKALFEQAATKVLPRWNVGEYRIDWVSYTTNAVFSVTNEDSRFILRLHAPGRVTERRLRSELTWLRAIRWQTDLLAPFPLPASDGRYFTTCWPPMLPSVDSVHCVLFERIAGVIKSARELSSEDVCRIGRYIGRLHCEAQIDLPVDFHRPRLDFEGLFGVDSPYYSANERGAISDEQRKVFDAVAQRVGLAMENLDREGENFGLIHADLLAKNVIFAGDLVAALDFEFSSWGYFLYDLAPLLWQLKGERAADYTQLEADFWSGYVSVRSEASDQREYLEDFIAARQLAACRWLLQNMHHLKVRELAPILLHSRTEELQNFLSTGVLKRRTATL